MEIDDIGAKRLRLFRGMVFNVCYGISFAHNFTQIVGIPIPKKFMHSCWFIFG